MSFEIKEVAEIYKVRGEQIHLKAPARFDLETGEQVFDENLDNAALDLAFDIYRKKNQMITVSRIKKTRQNLGLSQRDFAALLGWSPTTVANYETGALPSQANNLQLLELEKNPKIAVSLQEQSGSSMTQRGREILKKQLTGEPIRDAQYYLASGVEQAFKDNKYSEYTGYAQFDLKKFSAMVSFFVEHDVNMSTAKLNRLLFYADFKYFGLNTVSMSGVPYVHSDLGPAPKDYLLLYGVIEQAGTISLVENLDGTFATNHYVIQQPTELGELTSKELAILKDTLTRFAGLNTVQISQQSQNEVGWLKSSHNGLISYDFSTELSTLD